MVQTFIYVVSFLWSIVYNSEINIHTWTKTQIGGNMIWRKLHLTSLFCFSFFYRSGPAITINPLTSLCPFVRWRISATCKKKRKKKSYVGLTISYVGDNKSYVGLTIISYVGLTIISYVGLTNSYVGDSKSYVRLFFFFSHVALIRHRTPGL